MTNIKGLVFSIGYTVLLFFFMGCTSSPQPLHRLANPFVGTGGHGHTYPGATVPFGMVQLSPDSRLTGWDGCGGYHFSDSVIYGFSHTHLQGTGVSDYGDILFAPCTQFNDGATEWSDRYSSGFSHENEQAYAGYYQVHLNDQKINVELTTTERVGVHRYRLDEPDTLTLIIDMQHRDNLIHYSIYPMGDSMLVGHRVSDNWAQEQHVYFAAHFDQPFTWRDQLTEVRNTGVGKAGELLQEVEYVPVFAADFGVLSELNVEVALSFVSIDGALANLETEAVLGSFDEYREMAESTWDEQLSRILVQGGSDAEIETFYSALYHCFTAPNIANDVTGQYRGTDLAIHQLEEEEGNHYTVFSLWDTFRALHPLLNWVEPVRSRDFVRTMLRMYEEGGQLPVWELASNYTGCMIGYHSVPVIADADAWGIRGFDPELALNAMIQAADSAHLGLDAYTALGYIPLEEEHESVSKTLEYAFDDACISSFAAKYSKHSEQFERFRMRALNYRNLYNKESGFFQPKRSAAWLEAFDPKEVNFNYTEANGWQYNFFVPHDVNGHIDLLGGPSSYASKLEEMFTSSSETTGRNQADITGLIGQYAHGNEPSHHMAYLYPFVGQHHRTAELVDTIRQTLYTPRPDGLSGNEDCGQMSAWYVWSSLGMYPVTPGSDQLILGSPLFETARVSPNHSTNAGVPLTIEKNGRGKYIRSAQLQAKELPAYVTKQELLDGGTLAFRCQVEPSLFGQDQGEWPVERWESDGFIPVPVIHAPRTFKDLCSVSISTESNLPYPIQYALSPLGGSHSKPLDWLNYIEPFTLKASAVIHARTVQSDRTSSVVRHALKQVNHPFTLQMETPISNQYAAGGDQALIDGITGGNQYQTGDWQGYWGMDISGTIDLNKPIPIQAIRIGALRDIRPWIYLPKRISISCSQDGENWEEFGETGHSIDQSDEAPVRHTFEINGNETARFIRFQVENHGLLPEGHLGAGNPSWVFLDEVSIQTQLP
ncbi:MAG: glycosyl hydrolase family 92 [Crocinitomicaceae bacterium]|nr:glycosyl hydrolase family 92 [Crocinitomicaceae bacterium]